MQSLGPPPAGGSLFGRTWHAGDLVGILHGLREDAAQQVPTAVSFLSGYEPVGLSLTRFEASQFVAMGGLDVSGRAVVGQGGLQLNLADPVMGGRVLTFNIAVFGPPTYYNVLAWNGLPPGGYDDWLRPGVGNGLGMAGVSFAALSPVPEPTPAALLLLGAAVLARRSRPQRSTGTPAV